MLQILIMGFSSGISGKELEKLSDRELEKRVEKLYQLNVKNMSETA